MKKIVLLAILAGLALWYFDFSRRMTEQSIAKAYQEQTHTMNVRDAAYLCSHMASG